MASLTRYFAFLRAVNVGGRTVKSPALIKACESLGWESAKTFLASGNIAFDSPKFTASKWPAARKKLELQLEKELDAEVGLVIECFIRSLDEINQLIDLNPFELSDEELAEWNSNVAFLREPLPKEIQKSIADLASDYDAFHFTELEFYWLCRGPVSQSKLFERNRLVKTLGQLNTMRNVRTLKRMVALK